MEKYSIEFTKEQIDILQNLLESVYNRYCWLYHTSKMLKNLSMSDSNFKVLTEVATLMDEIQSQRMIQDGSKNI